MQMIGVFKEEMKIKPYRNPEKFKQIIGGN